LGWAKKGEKCVLAPSLALSKKPARSFENESLGYEGERGGKVPFIMRRKGCKGANT